MYFTEAGILPQSVRYLFTPSSMAERLFFYTTRIGHYFCNRDYHFHYNCEIGREPGHRLHYMLMQIKRGMKEFDIEGKHYVADSGSIVMFDCKRPHEYRALTDDLELNWMVFDGPLCAKFYEQILLMHGGEHMFSVTDQKQVQLIFGRILTNAELSIHRTEYAMAELIYSMLCLLISDNTICDTLVNKALTFMDQHFAEPLSVEDIASQVSISASFFRKYFRQQTGYSPHEYIVLRRIDHAKELLLSTDQTVSQISFASGYNSEENFIRSFKKKVGISPSAFRKYPV